TIRKERDRFTQILDRQMKAYQQELGAPVTESALAKSTKQMRMMNYLNLTQERDRLRNDMTRAKEMLAKAETRLRQFEAADIPLPDLGPQIEADPLIHEKMLSLKKQANYISHYRQTAQDPDAYPYPELKRRFDSDTATLEMMRKSFVDRVKAA